MAASLIRTISLMLLLSSCVEAWSIELLPDPTKPAVDLSSKGSGTGGAGSSDAAVPVVVKEVLQSVIISPQYRAAVINDETVILGGKFRGATLTEVRESSVLLVDAQGKRVLELFPGVRFSKVETVLAKEVKELAAPVEKKAAVKKVAHKHKVHAIKDAAQN
jgi:MSHA biogenesis protein MshK